MVVTIDGPAASGKSSTARLVANALGAHHIDSGALYRAVTAARARAGDDPDAWTEPDVLAAARAVTLRAVDGGFVPQINGHDVDDELRDGHVTAVVARVAQMPGVRAWVNEQVRAAADGRDVVVDGRDMGTVVFPRAELKVYLVADTWERARRRLAQRGNAEARNDEIADEVARLMARDGQDAIQSAAAADAIHIDTTPLTREEQVARIVALARARR